MATWGEVKRWQNGPMQNSVGPLNGEYNKLLALSDDLRDINAPYGWSGAAASAAAGAVNQIIDTLEEYAAEVAAARRGLGDTGDAILGIMHGVSDAEHLAAAHRFTIGDNGAVVDNGPPPDTPEDQKDAVARERQKIAAELKDRVEQVIRSATDVDDDLCIVLDRILSGHTIDAGANDNEHTSLAAAGNAGDALGSLSIPAPPPEGATAAQNAAYWSTLSEAQRTRLAKDRPELVGPRNGFSATQRDIANRILFDREHERWRKERDELQRKVDTFPRSGGGEIKLNDQHEFDALKAKLDEANGKVGGLDRIEQALADPPGTPDSRRHYLLGLDTANDGKVILSTGNPDAAKNVATYVPGTSSDLPSFGTSIDRADVMQRAADKVDATGGNAVIAWMGYDAPNEIPNAIFQDYANNGKHALVDFQNGLSESHKDGPAHSTVVGHSYGTTVVGLAMRDEGMAPGNVINVGSPGMGVHHASQLHYPGDQIYSIAADNDLVPDTQAQGNDPTDPSFGGRVINADPGPGGWMFGYSSDAHSQYWDPRNPALAGMGEVIAGHPPR
ncbi:alpha/beta hydrolase [Amycolatopsis sp. NPDC059657]|uniref:alpha/beta hydrolase n=1 Tax=Amycolatopsis sp. NPDC059657 TaxID=3346899 RepID=UPI00367041F8